MNITKKFSEFCAEKKIPFTENGSCLSYDDSTLFCPAGMQKFKNLFLDANHKGTIANIQQCVRLNDFREIGDGTHFASFKMIGLFSFRERDVSWAINFWNEFLERIKVPVDHCTIHSDMKEWANLHCHQVKFADDECTWSDGNIGGYCTEYYSNVDGRMVEIGNIVNPMGDCIDVGFGLERLELIVNKTKPRTRTESLIDAAKIIKNSGVYPSNKQHGYVLRKIAREIIKGGGKIYEDWFEKEEERQIKIGEKYEKLLPKNKDKSPQWWFDTHGVDVSDLWKD